MVIELGKSVTTLIRRIWSLLVITVIISSNAFAVPKQTAATNQTGNHYYIGPYGSLMKPINIYTSEPPDAYKHGTSSKINDCYVKIGHTPYFGSADSVFMYPNTPDDCTLQEWQAVVKDFFTYQATHRKRTIYLIELSMDISDFAELGPDYIDVSLKKKGQCDQPRYAHYKDDCVFIDTDLLADVLQPFKGFGYTHWVLDGPTDDHYIPLAKWRAWYPPSDLPDLPDRPDRPDRQDLQDSQDVPNDHLIRSGQGIKIVLGKCLKIDAGPLPDIYGSTCTP